MAALKSFEQWAIHVLEWSLILIFGFFIILVCSIVIFRFGFSIGLIGSDELVRKAFLYTSVIGGAVGIARHEHIAITVFIDILPRAAKMSFYIAGLTLIAAVNVAMIWFSWNWISMTGGFPWQPFPIPRIVIQVAVPIGCGLAVMFCLIKIVLTLGGRENIDVLWLPED